MVIAGFVIALAVLVDDAVRSTDAIATRLRADREAGRTPSLSTAIIEARRPRPAAWPTRR